jgi:hypothetical protein
MSFTTGRNCQGLHALAESILDDLGERMAVAVAAEHTR